MALYAFDGTGNKDEDQDERDSNVVKFFNAYTDTKKNDDPERKKAACTRRASGRAPGRSSAAGRLRRSGSAAIGASGRRSSGSRTTSTPGMGSSTSWASAGARRWRCRSRTRSTQSCPTWRSASSASSIWWHSSACRAVTSTPATSCRCPITSSAAATRWRWTSRESCFPYPALRQGRQPRRPARRSMVPRRSLRYRRRQRQPGPELDCPPLDVHERGAHRPADPPGRDRQEPAGPRTAATDRRPQTRSGVGAEVFANDTLHSSVVLGPGVGGRPHNDPKIVLARIDDEGRTVRQRSCN